MPVKPALQAATFLFGHALLQAGVQFVDIFLYILFAADTLQPFYGIVEESVIGHRSLNLMEVVPGQVAAQVVHQLLIVDVLIAIG